MPELTRASALSGLRETILELGGQPDRLARQCGVEFAVDRNQDALISLRSLQELADLASREVGRSDFGLLWGLRSDPALLGPLYVGMTNSETVGGGLDMAARYLHLHTAPLRLGVVDLPNEPKTKIILRNTIGRPAKLTVTMERNLVVLHKLMKAMAGPMYQPVSVLFAHPRQGATGVYKSIFGIAPRFNENVCAFGVAKSLMAREIAPRSGQLMEMAEDYLAKHGSPYEFSFSNRVAASMEIILKDGDGNEDAAARFVGLSRRALQRRLHDEGTTFLELRQQVRRRLTQQHLCDKRMSIAQIAQELGFMDQASFSRACRNWFGVPPTALRKSLAARTTRHADA